MGVSAAGELHVCDLDFDKEVTDYFGPGHSWSIFRGVRGSSESSEEGC